MDFRTKRPLLASIAALCLFAAAGLALLVGLLATSMSACCGSADPPDQLPAIGGVLVALTTATAGVMLWVGRPAREVLAAACVLPLACLVAARGSYDLKNLAPWTILAWGGLFAFLRTRRAVAWLAAERSVPDRRVAGGLPQDGSSVRKSDRGPWGSIRTEEAVAVRKGRVLSANQLRFNMGLGVAWMILGVFWGVNTNVWLGAFAFCLGAVQMFDSRRRLKSLDARQGQPPTDGRKAP